MKTIFYKFQCSNIKGHGNEPVFLPMFLHKSVQHESYSIQYHSSRSDFGFEFVEIFVFENLLPPISNTGSRRLRVSVIQESPTPRISDTVSSRLPVALSRGVGDSAYHWYRELTTPRIVESGSPPPLICELGSRFLKKISTIGNGWDLAEYGWDLVELWMSSSRDVDEI